MPDPNAPAQPQPRPAVGAGRLAAENLALLTPLGVVIAWLATLLPVEIPQPVQNSIAALVVGIGGLVLSEIRTNRHAQSLRGVGSAGLVVPILLAAVFLAGCVTWDGATYDSTALREIAALEEATSEEPLDPARCDAHRAAAFALSDEAETTARSPYLPLAVGPEIEGLRARHARQAAVCDELVGREVRGLAPDLRDRTRAAWEKHWTNGRALAGDGE